MKFINFITLTKSLNIIHNDNSNSRDNFRMKKSKIHMREIILCFVKDKLLSMFDTEKVSEEWEIKQTSLYSLS